MLDWNRCQDVERSADVLGGAWVFRNTRVPAAALFENIESAATIIEFLEWFSDVKREQVESVLEHPERSLAGT
jgi:uncharacterized protein (DUF433 family)